MLEQVREGGAAALLVFRPDVEPLVHVDDWQFLVEMQNYLQAVRQDILLEFQLRKLFLGSLPGNLRRGRRSNQRQHERQAHQDA